MDSIKSFADENTKKDMILELLRDSFPMVPEEDYSVMVDMVFAKLKTMSNYREFLKKKDILALDEAATMYDADIEAILDSYLYFFLVVETVYLQRTLFKLIDKIEEK